MSGFFLGDQSELEAKQRKENSNNGTSGYVSEIQTKVSQGRITEENIPLLSEDTLKRLKRTRLSNKEPYTVYMVSDPNYYDPFYNDPDREEDNPIIAQARTIKRVYKTYPEYLHAVRIKDEYTEYIIDKYGGWDRYLLMKKAQVVDDWVPPNPIYSNMAYDKHIVEFGTFIDPNEVEYDDEGIIDWMENKLKTLHTNPVDFEVKFDIFTDIQMYKTQVFYDKDISRHSSVDNGRRVLNAASMDSLNDIVRSWYVPEDLTDNKQEEKTLFALSPDNIRRQYMKDSQIGDPDLLDDILEYGEDALTYEDPDDMVVDNVTGKTMKRSELKRREIIRHLGQCGWDEIALLQEGGMASKYEINQLKKNKKNMKKAKKAASSAAYDLLGVDATSMLRNSAHDIFGPDISATIFGKKGDY